MSIDVHIDIVMSCHTMLLSYQIITVSQDYFHIPRMRHEKGNGPFFVPKTLAVLKKLNFLSTAMAFVEGTGGSVCTVKRGHSVYG